MMQIVTRGGGGVGGVVLFVAGCKQDDLLRLVMHKETLETKMMFFGG